MLPYIIKNRQVYSLLASNCSPGTVASAAQCARHVCSLLPPGTYLCVNVGFINIMSVKVCQGKITLTAIPRDLSVLCF